MLLLIIMLSLPEINENFINEINFLCKERERESLLAVKTVENGQIGDFRSSAILKSNFWFLQIEFWMGEKLSWKRDCLYVCWKRNIFSQ